MKLVARMMTLFMAMTFMVMAFNYVSSIEIRKNEMRVAASAAVHQTQKVVADQIIAKLEGREPPLNEDGRPYIASNADYADYFMEMFTVQVNSNTKYDIVINDNETDYEKGILSFSIKATFPSYAGIKKTLTFSKKSDVNVNGLWIPSYTDGEQKSVFVLGKGTDTVEGTIRKWFGMSDEEPLDRSAVLPSDEYFKGWYIDKELTLPLVKDSDSVPYTLDDLDPEPGSEHTKDNTVHAKREYEFSYYNSYQDAVNTNEANKTTYRSYFVYQDSSSSWVPMSWAEWIVLDNPNDEDNYYNTSSINNFDHICQLAGGIPKRVVGNSNVDKNGIYYYVENYADCR